LLNQSSIPELKVLAEALADVLPEDNSRGDPQYLSRSALDICLAGNWTSDELLVKATACASKYWAGHASEEEREKVRAEVIDRSKALISQGLQFSPEWCKCALAMSALDVLTPSNGFAADYLLEFSLKAGVSIKTIRESLVAHVPGLSEALVIKSDRPNTA
jgi:hypothetical protein